MSVTLRSSHSQKVTWLWREELKHNTLGGFATKLEQPLSVNRAQVCPQLIPASSVRSQNTICWPLMHPNILLSFLSLARWSGVCFPSGEMYLLTQYFFWPSFSAIARGIRNSAFNCAFLFLLQMAPLVIWNWKLD